jgi:hypothetical protein
MTKKQKIEVALEDGTLVMCNILERSFNPDVGARTIWCEHNGKEFMAVQRLGAWRKWTAADRLSGGRGSRVVGQ